MPSPLVRVIIALVTLAAPVAAQDSLAHDSLPFRRGQWAMQVGALVSVSSVGAFGVSVTTPGLGVLHFTSARHALLLDVAISGAHTHTAASDSLGGLNYRYVAVVSNANVSARIGARAYRVVARRAALYHSLGLLGGLQHQCQLGNPFVAAACTNVLTGGAFADLGGSYFVTRYLSLGGAVGVSASYAHRTDRGPGNYNAHSWTFSGGITGVSFATALYF